MQTLLLDTVTWDLLLTSSANIAVASEPYSLAQDAASAIKTFLGECFFDVTQGVNYSLILGENPNIAIIKAALVNAALTVPDVGSAQVFISAISNRQLSGQVQVTSLSTGVLSAAVFTVFSPVGGA